MYPVILAGMGRIAVQHLRAIQALPQMRLAGCIDPQPDRARSRLAKVIGAQAAQSLPCVQTLDALCADLSIWQQPGDQTPILAISARSDAHASLACTGLERGFALVLEKPMAIDLASCHRIVELAHERNLPVSLCHIYRFFPLIPQIRQQVTSGALGELITARAEVCWGHDTTYYQSHPGKWELGAGALMNQTIHAADLLRFLTGCTPSGWQGLLRQNQHHKMEVEDLGMGQAQLRDNPGLFQLLGTTATNPKHHEATFEILGTQGRIQIGIQGKRPTLACSGSLHKRTLLFQGLRSLLARPIPMQQAQFAEETLSRRQRLRSWLCPHLGIYADLVYSLETQGAPRADAEAGRDSVADILALYTSARANGRTVDPATLPDETSCGQMCGFFEEQKRPENED